MKLLRGIPALFPGLALSLAIMAASFWLASWAGRSLLGLQGIDPVGRASPISGVLAAILFGIAVRNLAGLSEIFKSGVRLCVTKVLRLGIILIGIKLSILDILKLGGWGIPIVAAAIAGGLFFVGWFNRLLGLPERLGTLIAAGSAICGVTAIVSTAPAIDADEKEVAYAVANITLFGLLAMFIYPYLAPYLFRTSEQIGLFLGTSIHETAQVVGAALTYKEVFRDETVLKAATVTKLTRNLFLAAVVPLLALLYLKRQSQVGRSGSESKVNFAKLFPSFVFGFVTMAFLRSLGDWTLQSGEAFGIWDETGWKQLTAQLGEVWGSRYLLGTAMAAVGLSTDFSVFKNIGLKPFAVGLAGAVFVGFVGLVMVLLLGPHVHL